MSTKSRLLVSMESGHVVVEDESGAVVVDFPCKSTPDAMMLKASLTAHVVGAMEKGQYIVPPSKKESPQ